MNAPMVRAVLDGSKKQTRRIAKLLLPGDKNYIFAGSTEEWASKRAAQCSYGQPGDLLWVREAFCDATKAMAGRVLYRATGDIACGWKPSIHMPRWASRILLEITDVRAERLQDISEADCIAEGAAGGHGSIPGYNYAATPLEHYKHIWETINGHGSWAKNPWVWVIKFKVVQS